MIDGTTLVDVQDDEFSGVVGWAGWETYLACSKGLPVIEILPAGRSSIWLSKWSTPLYRAISYEGAKAETEMLRCINQAKHNLEMVCAYLAEKERMQLSTENGIVEK